MQPERGFLQAAINWNLWKEEFADAMNELQEVGVSGYIEKVL